MGQAFDEQGNVLGEAFGNTKREVFDKLQKEHANAHELRIRSLMSAHPESPSAQSESPDEGCDKSLSQRVADLEKAESELAEIKATLWLNFGDTSRNKSGFVIRRQKTIGMLMEVLERLTQKNPPTP